MTPRARRVMAVVAAVVAAQVAAVAAYRAVERGRDQAAPFVHERLARSPAPDLELEQADGTIVRLSQARGRPVFLHFWATWCPPCRKELPDLLAVAAELEAKGILVAAVSLDDDWAAVQRFWPGDLPTVFARQRLGNAHRAFGVSTLPDTYIVDGDGALVARVSGPRQWRSEEARAFLRTYLGAP